ncbi:hypothetical protein GWE18_39050 [Bradyrhizobium sp. CSA112]|uniref:hypothetical protein n=1 Tax=Bradyrhizobium sp. CSA112 TaxID=2699170 RepID=UPI0023AE7C94|nr:hypothetical protein [Bradyrhizobium sp. CSA112]MDE5458662.1 hypothetical protein [Bradyrhizobium sp. CSA112]
MTPLDRICSWKSQSFVNETLRCHRKKMDSERAAGLSIGARGMMKGFVRAAASGELPTFSAVIASAAKQSICPRTLKHGLLRRFAPLRKRFAFVAGNDG